MWNSYILFNFRYISDNGGLNTNLAVALEFAKIFAVPLFCFFVELLQQKRNFNFSMINFSIFTFTLLFVVISGRGYAHYGIILLPFFIFPMSYVFNILKNNILKYSDKNKVLTIKTILLLCFLIPVIKMLIFVNYNYNSNEIVNYLRNNTSPAVDILVLGNDVQYYTKSQRYSNQRFFYQLPILKQNPSFRQEFLESITKTTPDYIILPNSRDYMTQDADFLDLFGIIEKSYIVKPFREGKVFIKDLTEID